MIRWDQLRSRQSGKWRIIMLGNLVGNEEYKHGDYNCCWKAGWGWWARCNYHPSNFLYGFCSDIHTCTKTGREKTRLPAAKSSDRVPEPFQHPKSGENPVIEFFYSNSPKVCSTLSLFFFFFFSQCRLGTYKYYNYHGPTLFTSQFNLICECYSSLILMCEGTKVPYYC